MSDVNPYASPATVEEDATIVPEPRLGNVVASTIHVVLARWTTILVALILLCFPWELTYSYLTNFALNPERRWEAFFLSWLGQSTVVLFAQGMVMATASLQLRGLDTGLKSTLAHTASSFPAIFFSGFACWLAVLIGCVLLIVPGVYLNVRWMYYGPAAVSEELPGLQPLQRSWELTKTHLLFSFAVFWLYALILIFVGMGLFVLLNVSPTLQHWVLTAAVSTVSHSMTLLACIGFTCGYHELVRVHALPPMSNEITCHGQQETRLD